MDDNNKIANMSLPDLHELCLKTGDEFRNTLFARWEEIQIDIGHECKQLLTKKLLEQNPKGYVKWNNNGLLLVSGQNIGNSIPPHEFISHEEIMAGFIGGKLCKAYFDYREVMAEALLEAGKNNDDAEKYVKDCLQSKVKIGEIERVFQHYYQKSADNNVITAEEIAQNVTYMCNFMTSRDWYFGSKPPSRHDYWGSALMQVLGMVNQSSGSVVKIAGAVGKNPELWQYKPQVIFTENKAENSETKINSTKKQAELLKKSRNRLLFGAPGTGKSFNLKKDQEGYFTRPSLYERVTFHPAYSYAQFFGSYKPVSENGTIVYRFVAGPFLRVLLRALSDPANSYLLIIEEINRADVAAVFGDVFQLLDRGKDGASEYPLDVPEDVIRYIDLMAERSEQTGFAAEINWGRLKAYFKAEGGKLRIPVNMYLWATMNSADQGVMPLDTAFKRRWQFEYKSIDEDAGKADYRTPDGSYVWQDIRNNINALLQKAGGIPEDRWLGPFFLKEADFADAASFKEIFKSKVLMYLYQDVARFAPADAVFQKPYTSYSELLANFDHDEFAVFAEWPEDSDA